MRIKIREPYWKYNAFGINMDAFAGNDEVEVECEYKNKQGSRVYPHIYKARKSQAEVAMKHTVKRGGRQVKLAVIPVEKLEVVNEKED